MFLKPMLSKTKCFCVTNVVWYGVLMYFWLFFVFVNVYLRIDVDLSLLSSFGFSTLTFLMTLVASDSAVVVSALF